MERFNLACAKKEYTTQKIRQEWAEHEGQILGMEGVAEEWSSTPETSSAANEASASTEVSAAVREPHTTTNPIASDAASATADAKVATTDETKSKKKRRKKSMMKKKATQRKGSSSSSVGSNHSDANEAETTGTTATSSSTDDSPKSESNVAAAARSEQSAAAAADDQVATPDDAPAQADSNADAVVPTTPTSALNSPLSPKQSPAMSRARDLDIHFFSDTELASAKSPDGSRPSTPIQSDSEFEMSNRGGLQLDKAALMGGSGSSASWKWGELPTQGDDAQVATTEDAKQAQRNSMLSNMFSFMKQTKKMRKTSQAEGVYLSELDTDGMDPEVAALYFPPQSIAAAAADQKDGGNGGAGAKEKKALEEDRESGNGTSLPHSPSSMDGLKSLDSDYDDGKPGDNK